MFKKLCRYSTSPPHRYLKKKRPLHHQRGYLVHPEDPHSAQSGSTSTVACSIWCSVWWFRLVVSWSISLCLVCVCIYTFLYFAGPLGWPNSGNIWNIRWIQYSVNFFEHLVSHVDMLCLTGFFWYVKSWNHTGSRHPYFNFCIKSFFVNSQLNKKRRIQGGSGVCQVVYYNGDTRGRGDQGQGVGVMRDKELKSEDVEVSDTWSWDWVPLASGCVMDPTGLHRPTRAKPLTSCKVFIQLFIMNR